MRIISGGFVKDSRSVSDAGVEVAGDPVDEIETGKRLVRVGGDRGISLAERIASQLRLLAWRSPLHRLRLRGRFPLKLITVPTDPIAGDAAEIGRAHVRTPVTNEHLVCRLLLAKNK